MARPFEKLPPGARQHLLGMAETSGLSEAVAAKALGMPLRDLRRVIKENPAAAAIWDEARAVERDKLLSTLWTAANNGDTKAAQWLLSSRHGITDKSADNVGERVNINLTLPPALDPKQYEKLLEAGKLQADKALGNG